MALPKMVVPKFFTTIPSTKEKVAFRPFLVKEEKALLLALESTDENSMVDAIKETISACVETKTNIEKLPFFDLEYLFLQIRAKSVGEEAKFQYRHAGGVNREGKPCEAVTDVVVKLDEVKTEEDPKHTNKIMLTDTVGVIMRYPTIETMKELVTKRNDFEVVSRCIESVFDENDMYEPENTQDAIQFMESLNSSQFAKIVEFFETMPKMKHTVTYNCKGCGQEDTVTFEGIADFF